MARLELLSSKRSTKSDAPSRANSNLPEGVQAKQLLEAHGFSPKRQDPLNGQYEFRCPFHEGPGELGRRSTNFYLDKKSSVYYCQSASCGEKGNLRLLERFFGIASDPKRAEAYESRSNKLARYVEALTKGEKRQIFYDKGLSDTTIERFKLGWDERQGVYVIPYLQGKLPVAFRYYDPTCSVLKDEDGQPKGTKYWWEIGSKTTLFNDGDAVGDEKGRVFITEGETKAMLLCQLGYSAMAVPGATVWKPEWSEWINAAKADHIYVVYDNDNPAAHYGDRDKEGNKDGRECKKCKLYGHEECQGHNPGQDGAARVVDAIGKRAHNVVLPRPEGERKVDINEYFMRDGHTNLDFGELVFGYKTSPFVVRSLAQIREDPPEESVFLVDQGILPVGGRLLVTGAPKAGKSIFIENLALSLAAGIPFLKTFNIKEPCRVLLLDRELSERSLYDRLNILIDDRPGYRIGEPNLLVDHKTLFRLDQPNAESTLIGLIQANRADVVIFDTAYKFFSGEFDSAAGTKRAFDTVDAAIAETGVSVVMTHHHKKKQGMHGKEEAPDPDQVAGSFLWTGWPNATVLINFLDRRVQSPFNTVASFTAFRDAAPPEPLALYRDRESIAYKSIVPYHFGEDETQWQSGEKKPLTFETLADALLEAAPVIEDDFLHMAAAIFGASQPRVRLHLLDIGDRHPDFVREGKGTRNDPFVWKYRYDKEEETFEQAMLAQGHKQMEI